MSQNFWEVVGLLLRVVALLALSLGAAATLRRSPASLRRWVLLLGAVAALALPLVSWLTAGHRVLEVEAPRAMARVVNEALLATPTAAPMAAAAPRAATSAATPWLSLLVAVWLAGSALVLLRLLLGVVAARRLASRSVAANGVWRFSRDIEGPVVVGVFWPQILLPCLARGWSGERLQSVLLHEQAHVRRRDGLALLLAQAMAAGYWFLPLSWWLVTALRRECELSADEDVIAAGVRPTTYAEHLLEVARDILVPHGAVAMAARPSELARRIQALVSRSGAVKPLSLAGGLVVAAAASGVVALAACSGTRSEAKSAAPALVAKDAPAQRVAREEAERARSEWSAQRVAVVVLDVKSGALLGSVDDAPGAPIVPASTLKPLTVAVALEADAIKPDQRFDCGGGKRSYGERTLSDVGPFESLSVAEILAVSSNVGTSRIFDAVGGARLSAGLLRLNLQVPSPIPDGLPGAIIAIGEGSWTTPLALAQAYRVLANDGKQGSEQLLGADAARTVRGMLEGVVSGERATGKLASVPGVRVGGKTGTSADEDCESCAKTHGVFANFVGIVPIDEPRYVIYVGVGGPARPGTGGTIAAPVFARIAGRLLASR